MKTLNFEILQDSAPDLANSGGFAERYVHTDPASSVVKLRIIAEQIVLHIFDSLDIRIPRQSNLCVLLEDPTFQQIVPREVRYKIDAIRIHGNAGAHGRTISEETALWLLHETFQLVCWFFLTYLCKAEIKCPEYQSPPKTRASHDQRVKLVRTRKLNKQTEKLIKSVEATETPEIGSVRYSYSEQTLNPSFDPLVDIRAMLARLKLRELVGNKTQKEVIGTGKMAAITLHLLDSSNQE